jgi:hypothetical protein
MAVVVVVSLRSSLAKLRREAPALLSRWQAIAAMCAPRGMLPNPANLSEYLPMANPSHGPTFGNAFGSPDGSLWAADLWRRDDTGKVLEAFSMLVFSVVDVNMPYVAVARKGPMTIPAGAKGKTVELESIDFNDRFAIRAEDNRSAVMLLDLGMMQLMLDCDQVSFEMSGDRVQALVKRSDQAGYDPSRSIAGSPIDTRPVELELLFKFYDGFLPLVPGILRNEYATHTA